MTSTEAASAERRELALTLIICSRDRAAEVATCLPHVAEQAREFEDVEVIVVDNGSTDNTREVVEQLSVELGYAFRYVFEPVAGLCQARNRGRAEARGRVLSYIDDDEEIQPGFIGRIRDHFEAGTSDCLGGKIGLRLMGEPPFPVDDQMLWFFCTTTLGEEPRPLVYPEHPNGGCMSFRVDVFDAVGGFDTNLKLYGDETEFFRRVTDKGYKMFYDPQLVANQIIPKERLTKEEIRYKSMIRGQGAASAWMLGARPGLGKRLSKGAEYSARFVYVYLRSLTGGTFGRFFTLWFNWGFLTQILRGFEVR
jgi:glycosyltransferase involved in cell wall biosynthesis